MFTSAKIRNGSTYLENHLSANDYYAKGERVKGQWVGQGAESLGLTGEVRPEDFEALRVNQRPGTGNGSRREPRRCACLPWLRRRGHSGKRKAITGTAQEVANFRLSMKPVSNRVAFFDFNARRKSRSRLLAVLGGDKRLRTAHEEASRIALAELERFASRQRNTLLQRHSEVTGNICAAAFTHDASRALDPQLHTHFVIANATCDRAGKWYALNEYEMVRAVRYAGKVYQNEMARAVQKLGYGIRLARQNGEITGFEIEGVSDALCERFSKRREEIERQIREIRRKAGTKAYGERDRPDYAGDAAGRLEGNCYFRGRRLSAFPVVARGIADNYRAFVHKRKRKRCRFKLVRSTRHFEQVSRISSSEAASCANTKFWLKPSTSRSDRSTSRH